MLFEKSQQKFARAREIDAFAFTAEGRLPANKLVDGAYPIYASRAEGPYVWDVDGNRFLDFMLAFGTVVLGHGDPDVLAAVKAELDSGLSCSIQKANRLELLELLVEVIPGAEAAFLLKTGSDATSAAVRLARLFTGRPGVVRWGYHGWHDWCCPRADGVPAGAREGVTSFEYNDPESLERAFASRPGEVACLIMMPLELEAPAPGFLRQAKEIAHRHGALFVLDEVRTGFRLGLGGAQARYDVVADLATFSKAIANGFEVSAITGRRDVLACLGRTHVSSTFFNNSAAMAAAIATIRKLRETDPFPRLERLGGALLAGMDELAARHGVPARAAGVPTMPFLRFASGDAARDDRLRSAFYREVTPRGFLLFPQHHWFVSAAMTDAHLGETLAAFDAGFAAAKRADAGGR